MTRVEQSEPQLLSVRVMENFRRMTPEELERIKEALANDNGEIVVTDVIPVERLDRLEERVVWLEKKLTRLATTLRMAEETRNKFLTVLGFECVHNEISQGRKPWEEEPWKSMKPKVSLQNENPEGSEHA